MASTPGVVRARQISYITKELEAAWHTEPNQRLGQFLINLANDSDLFYMEDDAMLTRLREHWRPWTP